METFDNTRLATYFHIHLISDSTGETLNIMARAVCARFDNILPIEHIHALIRSNNQLQNVIQEIKWSPGIVLHTISNENIRKELENNCIMLGIPCVAALDIIISTFVRYLGAPISTRIGAQHTLNNDYFNRMDALNYAINHDDGQNIADLESSDVILIGVSRTSKTPTSIYLAHRGIRAANVPLILGTKIPDSIFELKHTIIIGLILSPDRLIQIRRNRLLHLGEDKESNYIEIETVRKEIIYARKLFENHGWPIIDVTRRSVEETAAEIINIMNKYSFN